MPVVSSHRTSSSGLSGSYRTAFTSSTLYGTTSYSPRYSSYSRGYESEARRYLSRTGSINEDGYTARYRDEQQRRDSLTRDCTTNSILLDGGGTRRDTSLTRSTEAATSGVGVVGGRYGTAAATSSVGGGNTDTIAELRSRYSVSNYTPNLARYSNLKDTTTSTSSSIARSKTLNDIGLPPIKTKKVNTQVLAHINDDDDDGDGDGDDNTLTTSTTATTTTTSGSSSSNITTNITSTQIFNNTTTTTSSTTSAASLCCLTTNTTNCNNINNNNNNNHIDIINNIMSNEDDNNNRPSVSEICKKFDRNFKVKKVDGGDSSVNSSVEKKLTRNAGDVANNHHHHNSHHAPHHHSVHHSHHSKTTPKLISAPTATTTTSTTATTTTTTAKRNASNGTTTDKDSKTTSGTQRRTTGLNGGVCCGSGGGSGKLNGGKEMMTMTMKHHHTSSHNNHHLIPAAASSNELRNTNHVNNFASYIPMKDYDKGDQNGDAAAAAAATISTSTTIHHNITTSTNNASTATSTATNCDSLDGVGGGCCTTNNVEHQQLQTNSALIVVGKQCKVVKTATNKDLTTTSPRLNRSPIPTLTQNASAGPSDSAATSSQRNSLEKDGTPTSSSCGSSNNCDGVDSSSTSVRHHYSTSASRASPSTGIRQMGLNGLKNIGNTCFMNSVIQCLSNTKPLLEYVKKDAYANDINTTLSSMKGALIKAFAQVLKELWSEDSSDRVVNTVSLKSQIQRFAPRFMGYSQQDAQEFLRYLLEGLHEDVNRVIAKQAPIHSEIDETLSDSAKATESWQRYLRRENSKIVDIFVGQLKSTLKCTHCGHCSVTFDPFWDLSLPIPQKVGPIRLSQCLDSFTREETLDGDEKPTCSKCKERRKCTKSFTIHKFPKILVIHLKRFSPTERYRGKLSVTVDFPLEGLDMSNYAAETHTQCRYNLYAISNHSGTTYSGHYTAYCRHPYSQSWHEYNDSRVSSISAKSIVSGEAYVLFYELDSKLAHL